MRIILPCAILVWMVFASAIRIPDMAAEAKDGLDVESVVKSNTAFALDLYRKLSITPENLFFSPYSISTAMAALYAGARGHTARQMADVLYYSLEGTRLHTALGQLSTQLNTIQAEENVSLRIANALWIQQDHVVRQSFVRVMQQHYGTPLRQVDFKNDPEAVREQINIWIAQQTEDKITELIQPGILGTLTRLVLANAIYFKGPWASQFDPRHTENAPFRLASEQSVQVPMMAQQHTFPYAESDGLQILQLPYVGDTLSMIVLLPRALGALSELEAALTTQNLKTWIGQLRRTQLHVFLPKFTITSQFRLRDTLAAMGMPDAFGETADFSGIDGKQELSISAVIHQALVEVGEEGTEAAAATAGAMQATSAIRLPPKVVRIDHPFIFLIRDNRSGSIVFVGRLVNPVSSTY